MIEKKIKIEEEQNEFIAQHEMYGFENADQMIKRALNLLMNELKAKAALESSADLYADVYESDEEIQEWTESAINDWE